MGLWQLITWSKEHTSKSTPKPHRDVHSRSSDSSKNPKIGHAYTGGKGGGKGGKQK